MIQPGDQAPEFTLLTAHDPPEGSHLRPVALCELVARGPAVLAFFPAAFTGVCEKEMCAFRDDLKALSEADAAVVGISVDMPFAQKAFAERLNLAFPLLSDLGGVVAASYGVAYDDFIGLSSVAKRAVFVVGTDGAVTYSWVTDDPTVEPNYAAVMAAVQSLRTAGE
ncbi:redoxin domain-containing protein [bacterium]|nr:redoxin domain-containing protein [bacterium]